MVYRMVLNVGGKRFYTTTYALRNNPGPDDWSIFNGIRFPPGKEKFIDRDPELFAYILDYMREGKVHVPKNGHLIARLEQEAHVRFLLLVNLLQPIPNNYIVRAKSLTRLKSTMGFSTCLKNFTRELQPYDDVLTITADAEWDLNDYVYRGRAHVEDSE